MEQTIKDLKEELKAGKTDRVMAFLDLVLSNGDVLVELEEQLKEEE